MELLTAAQMRGIEQAAMDSGAVTGFELMERAGRGVVAAIYEEWPEFARDVGADRGASPSGSPGYLSSEEGDGGRAVVLCGPGNNGGDGFVVARLLRADGWDVVVHAMEGARDGDAASMRGLWLDEGGEILPLEEGLFRAGASADLYVDAIFGTGLSRAPSGALAGILRYLGGSGGDAQFYTPRLVAIDAPSGVCLDSGRMLAGGRPEPFSSTVPLARLTVTFECPKIGHFVGDGPAVCGKLAVVDLGLAKWRELNLDQRGIRLPTVQLVTTKRMTAACAYDQMLHKFFAGKGQGHKFDHGHAVVVAGGFGATGAARLAARAALRVGAGLVTVAARAAAMPECAAQLTSIMLRQVDDADGLTKLVSDDRVRSLCIGPGLGLDDDAAALVGAVLDTGKPAVLDADALTLIARDDALRGKLHERCVLTPHMGEFARLCPDLTDALLHPREARRRAAPSYADVVRDPQKVQQFGETLRQPVAELSGPAFSKIDATRDAAERLGCTVLLKGPDTIIAGKGPTYVHAAVYERAAPWLATAGAGDVLAGLITGLLARIPYNSSVATAAWLHVECARAFGPGLIAEDLPDMLPAVLRDLESWGG